MRTLRQLVYQRRSLVDEGRRITNRRVSAVKRYFPGCPWNGFRNAIAGVTAIGCSLMCSA